ncbi:hypothetical protein NPN16_24485, partial [Vibrio parahaemolyticus]|uniref:hypothetical protein n=1 Tax=Vibrio parahaemolyticus TaxID=670 RepID=UPI002111F832
GVSLLAGWKEDWAHTTEKSLNQAAPQMKAEMLAGEATSNLPSVERQSSNANLQVWGENNFRSNQINIAPMSVAQSLQTHEKP